MTQFTDLTQCTYFGTLVRTPLIAVGWLGSDVPPSLDTVPGGFVHSLVDRAPAAIRFRGWHACEICRKMGSEKVACGTANIFVPFEGKVYAAPEMIADYITAHGYAPPGTRSKL
jgi:hypothetical protein